VRGPAIVEGPPGIGKTRLLAAAGAAAEDLEVLRARASELERDFPFGVVRQLFEPVFFAAGEERRSVRGAARSLLVCRQPGRLASGAAAGRRRALADAASLRWLTFLALGDVPLALGAIFGLPRALGRTYWQTLTNRRSP
jgi:hypothetical protein